MKPPKDLGFYTAMLFLAGAYMAYIEFQNGRTLFMTIYGSLSILSLLTWFNQRWVAIPLLVYFSLILILIVICIMFFKEGFTFIRTVKFIVLLLCIYSFWVWYKEKDLEEERMNELHDLAKRYPFLKHTRINEDEIE